MKKVTLAQLAKMKQNGEKIAMLTAYDASFSQIFTEAGVDIQLIGDTLGMVVMGYDTTVPVTIKDIVHHTRCVARGNQRSFLIADLPFMTYSNIDQAIYNAKKLLQAGAHMVKLEGGSWLIDTVEALADRGVAVCCHIGLTPQSVHALGGYKVQGRGVETANQLLDEAEQLQQAGAKLLVLECVPHSLATAITEKLSIPVIGIGAGPDCDGQVLVTYDILGLSANPPSTFARNFIQGCTGGIQEAIANYVHAVKAGTFPNYSESFE